MIFFVAFGSTATRMTGVNWGDVRNNLDVDADPDLDNFFGAIIGTKYEFTDNFAEPYKDGSQIKLLGGRGDIKVTPSTDGQVHVMVQKAVRSESKSDAL